MSQSSKVVHRTLQGSYPIAASGEGVYVTDNTGNTYLDACGGAAVCCLGYSNQRVKNAMLQQINALPYIHSSFFTTQVMETFAEELLATLPSSLSHVYFVSGGSEAVETALKMARQYFYETDRPSRRHVIARRQSYHGNTLGALAAGGNLWRRQPFDAILLPGHHIAPPYAYRDQREDETDFAYGQRIANELEDKILELGADNVMAFIAETVVGATSGALTAPPGYFRRIREICDQYGVLLILDEVMCGMGRTGTLHACEQEGICGDIQTVAKGIAAGYQPLGAVFVSSKIIDALQKGSGMFQHGHTYIGHATACAAGLATLKEIQERDLLSNVRRQGEYLQSLLKSELGNHPCVGDIRGRGLFVGVELVEDKDTKKPFSPSAKVHSTIKKQAMEAGLMCYPMGGTVDGQNGDHILLAPPYIIEKQHIERIVEVLSSVIKHVTTVKSYV